MFSSSEDAADSVQSFGLASRRAQPSVMTVAHRHDDIELNFAPSTIEYLIDGVRTTIPANTVVAFWAARPHQLLSDTAPPWLHWLTVPLREVLSFGLPGRFTSSLLRGGLMSLHDDGRQSANERLGQWAEDLALDTADRRTIVALEVHAFLRRTASTASVLSGVTAPASRSNEPTAAVGLSHAAVMAEFIAKNAASPISVRDVAHAAHLHPNYAMTVFRRSIGITIGDYLALSRVAHAQRLLITTAQSVSAVAHSAGFRSASQFYERFGRACGMSPAVYRRAHGANSAGPTPPSGLR